MAEGKLASSASGHSCFCSVIPEHLLEAVANSPLGDPVALQAARNTLTATKDQRDGRLAIQEQARNPGQQSSGGQPSPGDQPPPSSGGLELSNQPQGGSPGPFPGYTQPGNQPQGGSFAPSWMAPSDSAQTTTSQQKFGHAAVTRGRIGQRVNDNATIGDKDQVSPPERVAPATVQVSRTVVPPSAAMRRHIFDSEESKRLSGTFVRTEEGPESQDESVIRSFNGLSVAYHFYKEVFGQISLDFRGSPLGASVHHHHNMQNASWNSGQMIFCEGDGVYWLGFTSSLDVTWRELTHRVISSSCKLIYNRQSGALNERLADVFGISMAQWHSKFDVTIASWLLGAELFTAKVKGPGGIPAATRSMKAPGTGYHDPVLEKDLQVDHMAKLWTKERDYGGVHFNSGTPNKVFYTVAAAMGGYSWKTVGPFWYYVMTQSGLRSSAMFQDFANTLMKAAKSFGSSKLQRAMKQAWADVGIDV